MGKRVKPKSPEQILREAAQRRREDFTAAGLEPEMADLPVYADVTITRKDRKHGRTGAWRSNVFNLLLERKTITANQHDAAYRLSLDWAAWKGLDGKPETFGEIVDGGVGSAELITDRMIRAGKDVAWVLGQLCETHDRLMRAFMVATVEEDRPMAWRGIVERTLLITAREAQTDMVVAALECLRAVYQEPGRVAA